MPQSLLPSTSTSRWRKYIKFKIVEKPKKMLEKYAKLTLEMFRAADKFNAREQGNAAWQQHGEAAHLHATFLACGSTSLIPSHKWPATRCIVNMIEQAAFGDEQGVRLEWSFCKSFNKRKKKTEKKRKLAREKSKRRTNNQKDVVNGRVHGY